MKKMAMPLLLVVLLASCVTTQAIMLADAGAYPPVKPSQVRVFMSKADIEQPYEKVALLSGEGNYSYTDQSDMIEALKKKAAEVGANAIILGELTEPGAGEKFVNVLFGTGADRERKVLAIRLLPGS